MIKYTLTLLVILLLTSCDGNKQMREEFGNNELHVVQDIESKKYYKVKHHVGSNYLVAPLKGVLKELVDKDNISVTEE